ncbi:MAG: hypothetical protein GX557_15270 [Chloroflexi bacterium]|nr:hypothetical protein [Chloroflexota bacterium]
MLAVPLMYLVARAWAADLCSGADAPRSALLALLAAAFAAFWPLLVYYGQVTRMYSWSALWVLAAARCALVEPAPGADGSRSKALRAWCNVGLVLFSAAALYTLYHTAWPIAAIWLYAALRRPQRLRRLVLLGFVTLALFAPWLVRALATIGERLASDAVGARSLGDWLGLLWAPIEGLAFVQGAGRRASVALALMLVAALLIGRPRRVPVRALALPVLALAFSVVGVAVGSQQLWFAPRHLVPATPFLGLLLAWALTRLAERWWPLCAASLVALAVLYGPAATGLVYEKNLEVTDPFDPSADHRHLSALASAGDLVYFNALSKAGWYENLRTASEPGWSYTLRWEPIVEPMEVIRERVTADARTHERLWFVLYNGDYGPNADLVDWLDTTYYPASAEWGADTLYLGYVAPATLGEWLPLEAQFAGGVRLVRARCSDAVAPGAGLAVELAWTTEQRVSTPYKVFVHVVDANGAVLAQHDAMPGAGRYPADRWDVGETVLDRHGILLPTALSGDLTLRVGLYDPATGARLPLQGGGDALTLPCPPTSPQH